MNKYTFQPVFREEVEGRAKGIDIFHEDWYFLSECSGVLTILRQLASIAMSVF